MSEHSGLSCLVWDVVGVILLYVLFCLFVILYYQYEQHVDLCNRRVECRSFIENESVVRFCCSLLEFIEIQAVLKNLIFLIFVSCYCCCLFSWGRGGDVNHLKAVWIF